MRTEAVSLNILTPPFEREVDHVRGVLNAPVNLVEYGDFECPFCQEAYPIVKDILTNFKPGVLFAFRHFPLRNLHPHAELAAEAAEAAGAQGAFWEMHDMLFEHPSALDKLALLEYAMALRLDIDSFEDALLKRTFLPRVERDIISGIQSGVGGTPTFFISGVKFDGPHTYRALTLALERAAGSI